MKVTSNHLWDSSRSSKSFQGSGGRHPQFITCSYPNETVDESNCRSLAYTTKHVVSVFHGESHFVVADFESTGIWNEEGNRLIELINSSTGKCIAGKLT
jgi:hypothetical protein